MQRENSHDSTIMRAALLVATFLCAIAMFGGVAGAQDDESELTRGNNFYRFDFATIECVDTRGDATLFFSTAVASGTTRLERDRIIEFTPLLPGLLDPVPEQLPLTQALRSPGAGELILPGLPDRVTEINVSLNDSGVYSRREIFAPDCDPGFGGPAGGVVAGVVWIDENGDGIRAINEPVADNGVTTELHRSTADGTPLELVQTGQTDPAGRWVFEGLTIGETYVVKVELGPGESFATPNITADQLDSDFVQLTGLSGVVTLAATGSEPNIDAGIVVDADLAFDAATQELSWFAECDSRLLPERSGLVGVRVDTNSARTPLVTIEFPGLEPKTERESVTRTARPDGVYEVAALVNGQPASTRMVQLACGTETPQAIFLTTSSCVVDGALVTTTLAGAECASLVRIRSSLIDQGGLDTWFAGGDPCAWRGVTCEIDNRTGRSAVTELLLAGNGVGGTLDSAVGELSSLEVLRITNSAINGPIPGGLADAQQLQRIELDNNGFSGALPIELTDLSELTELSAEGNALSGPIPAGFGQASTLEIVNLSRNELSGAIPPDLGQLQLAELLLNDNQLTGAVPAELAQLSDARLWLQRNALEGDVPREFHAAMQRGLEFDARDNALTGLLISSEALSASFRVLCLDDRGVMLLTFHVPLRDLTNTEQDIGFVPTIVVDGESFSGNRFPAADIEELVVGNVRDGVYAIDTFLSGETALGAPLVRSLMTDQSVTVDCEPPPPATATVAVRCINNDGAVTVDVDNPTDAAVTATLEVSGLSARTTIVEPGDSTRLFRSGRRDGDYQVVVSLDGEIVHDMIEIIACDPNPLDGLAVEITNTCIAGNGLIVAVVINDSAADATATLRVTGLAPRTSTVAAAMSERLIRSGRPDGNYRVELEINGIDVVDRNEVVDCDPDPAPGGEVEVELTSRCIAGNGAVFAQILNMSGESAQATLRVTGLPPKVTQVAAGNVITLSRTGRPDRTYRIVVDIDGAVAVDRDVVIDCDLDPVDQRDGVLGNRAWIDGNANALQDINEAGLGGVTVTLWLTDTNGNPTTAIDSTSTDAAGMWSFTGVSRLDTHVVQFTRPDGFAFVTALRGPQAIDSNPTPSTGITGPIRLGTTRTNNTIDAGLRRLG